MVHNPKQLDKQRIKDQKTLAKLLDENKNDMKKTTVILKKFNKRAENRIKKMEKIAR